MNPLTTVKYVPVWGSVGDWVVAIATTSAVVLSLHYSRNDDKECLKLQSLVHAISDGKNFQGASMTFRATCTGRLPTTVMKIGFGLESNKAAFYPVARYTTVYDKGRTHLSRGEIVEATLDQYGLIAFAREFSELVGDSSESIRFIVGTSLENYRVVLSNEARDTLDLCLKHIRESSESTED
ncbi:hypothetical protein [Pseudomonas fragi]|uniref:hypothetical protein n=1 Tax=Pseudomonas fragi TaxID=296 RepID=UPI00147319D7|nr:hypothetical protein [Pseudomonas fragi]NNB54219.1 hypothetical protein [Pseudomonas fragi]